MLKRNYYICVTLRVQVQHLMSGIVTLWNLLLRQTITFRNYLKLFLC